MVVGVPTPECIEVDAMAIEVHFAPNEPPDPFGGHREGASQQRYLTRVCGSPDVDGFALEWRLEVELELLREARPGGCRFDAAGRLVSVGGDVRRRDPLEVLDVCPALINSHTQIGRNQLVNNVTRAKRRVFDAGFKLQVV